MCGTLLLSVLHICQLHHHLLTMMQTNNPHDDNDSGDNDEFITESTLGTKEYWEAYYDTELTNFVDNGDQGDTWFGERNAQRIVKWIVDNFIDKNVSICDLGCGNGYILSLLAQRGYHQLTGVDYSIKAIDFCRHMYCSKDQTTVTASKPMIQFKVVDILQPNDSTSLHNKRFDVLLDKGTYDAIALMPDTDIGKNRKLYLNFVRTHLCQENGHFIIMSCNFTKDELLKFLLNPNEQNNNNNSGGSDGGGGVGSNNDDLLLWQLIHEFDTPIIAFGGKIGKQVTGLVLKRVKSISEKNT